MLIAVAIAVMPITANAWYSSEGIYCVGKPNSYVRLNIGTTSHDIEATVKRNNEEVSGIVKSGDTVIKDDLEYIAIVRGDINGDNKINSTDFMLIRRVFLGQAEITEYHLKAADIDENGKVNSTDFIKLRLYFMNEYDISNKEAAVFEKHYEKDWKVILKDVEKMHQAVSLADYEGEESLYQVLRDKPSDAYDRLCKNYSGVEDLYEYLANISKNNNYAISCLYIDADASMVVDTTYIEFINKFENFYADIELKELTKAEFDESGQAVEACKYADEKLMMDFCGDEAMPGMNIILIRNAESITECTFILGACGRYYEITNYDEVKRELLESFAVIRGY